MLAVGIAGNTAIFSIYNGLFLRPLPFRGTERLVDLNETAPKWNLRYVGVANADFHAWRDKNTTFEQMAFYTSRDSNLSGSGPAQRIKGVRITRGMLDVLNLKPAIGRDFLPEEDRPNGAKVVLIGNALWRRLFSGDANVLGRVLKLDAEPYTVVGVLPAEAVFPMAADVWFPLAVGTEGGSWYLNGIGRLKPGVTVEQARADLTRIHRSLIATGRAANEATSPVISGVRERMLGDFKPGAIVLLGAVAVVLLIACADIAGLMTVRAFARSREMAIRAALGASRADIVRQLLAESVLLAAAGGAAGMLLGRLGVRAIIASMPEDTPAWVSFAPDLESVVFGIAITVAAAVLFGLAPALNAARGNLQQGLHDTARTSLSRRRRSFLSALVVGEIGLALLLLTSAGLMFQALRGLLKLDPGFRPENALTFGVAMPQAKYAKEEQRIAFVERLMESMRALPGVKHAGAASSVPLGGHWGEFFVVEGRPPLGPNDQNPVVLNVAASPGYLDAIGVTFLSGRQFRDSDGAPGSRVAIINETFAKRFFPNGNPLGRHIRYGWDTDKPKWIEIIGVTRDVKHYGLDREMRPSVYVPFRQYAFPFTNIMLRTTIDPQALIAPAREALRRLDPDLPLYQPATMTERLDRSLWQRRFLSWVAATFAGMALLLAAGGIFGVISHAVSQRTQEIGIRMAMGASPARVLRQVLGQGLLLLAFGTAIGIAAALALATVLQRALFGISARDPLTYAAAVAAVSAVVLASNIVPARRAANVDPIKALRTD